jgi:hypothetical protein
MNVVHLTQSGASVHHRGPGKRNLATIRACNLADLVKGTAGDWAHSPKKIVEGIGAPFSHEYLRQALKLTAADRWGVVLGWTRLSRHVLPTPHSPSPIPQQQSSVSSESLPNLASMWSSSCLLPLSKLQREGRDEHLPPALLAIAACR